MVGYLMLMKLLWSFVDSISDWTRFKATKHSQAEMMNRQLSMELNLSILRVIELGIDENVRG